MENAGYCSLIRLVDTPCLSTEETTMHTLAGERRSVQIDAGPMPRYVD